MAYLCLMRTTEVCIIGAGPAGSMAALRLAREGIPFIILDKDVFPRGKICGDALSGKVPHIMRRLSDELYKNFLDRCHPLPSFGIRFVTPGDYTFDVPFIHDYDPARHPVPGFTVKREVLDNFMLDEVKKVGRGSLMTGCKVQSLERVDDGFLISTDNDQVSAAIVIDASGTISGFKTPYVRPEPSPHKTALAVRSYFEGVGALNEQNYIELYFLPEVLPGYIWVFPLPGGIANAGIGIRKDVVLKKRINLSTLFNKLIHEHPVLSAKFANARSLSKPAAYHLPLGWPHFRISGERYLLTGDAAHLVDPLTGEGVGNAMYSGFIAAEQVSDCIKASRYDTDFMKAYDERINRVLGPEMRLSGRLQKLLKYPGFVKMLARRADRNRHVPGLMSSMFTDLSHRKKLTNPLFLIRVLLNI